MTQTKTRSLRWLSTLLAAGLFALHPDWISRLDWWLFDSLSRWTTPGAKSQHVAIVEIDDASLAEFGRWPWPRQRVADLVNAIHRAGAKVVALDMMFAEPSGDDARLSASLGASNAVGGYYFNFAATSGAPNSSCLLHPVPSMTPEPRTGEGHFHAAPQAVCNVPSIAQALSGSGFLNAAPDSDGLLRRVPLFVEHGAAVYPSLALATVSKGEPVRNIALARETANLVHFQLNGRRLNLDGSGSVLPRFRPPEAFARVPATRLLNGTADPSLLKDKIVFAGVSAKGLGSSWVTAAEPSYGELDVHASVAESLLDGATFTPPGSYALIEFLLLLVVGVGTAAASPRAFLQAGLPVACGLALLPLPLFARWREFVSPVLPLLALAGNGVAVLVMSAIQRRAQDQNTALRLASAQEFLLSALASVTALKDSETGAHLARVQAFLDVLCRSLQNHPRFRSFLTPENIRLFITVAQIHDIGKVGIPDRILKKPGRLTDEEVHIIRQHVVYGREILEKARAQSNMEHSDTFTLCCDVVRCHHERWDGTGYPDGLMGDQIPIPARMLALVDVYDAMVHSRVYKTAMPHLTAVQEIAAERGSLFDPDIVDAFLAHQHEYAMIVDGATSGPLGAQVRGAGQ